MLTPPVLVPSSNAVSADAGYGSTRESRRRQNLTHSRSWPRPDSRDRRTPAGVSCGRDRASSSYSRNRCSCTASWSSARADGAAPRNSWSRPGSRSSVNSLVGVASHSSRAVRPAGVMRKRRRLRPCCSRSSSEEALPRQPLGLAVDLIVAEGPQARHSRRHLLQVIRRRLAHLVDQAKHEIRGQRE